MELAQRARVDLSVIDDDAGVVLDQDAVHPLARFVHQEWIRAEDLPRLAGDDDGAAGAEIEVDADVISIGLPGCEEMAARAALALEVVGGAVVADVMDSSL